MLLFHQNHLLLPPCENRFCKRSTVCFIHFFNRVIVWVFHLLYHSMKQAKLKRISKSLAFRWIVSVLPNNALSFIYVLTVSQSANLFHQLLVGNVKAITQFFKICLILQNNTKSEDIIIQP